MFFFMRKRPAFKGGVHPDDRKQATSGLPIEPLPLPARLYLPVQQHIGAAARPVVTAGDTVLKGQMIARGDGAVSAAVHAPTSGRILAVEPHPAPHPSGLPVETIVIEPDGEDRRQEEPDPEHALNLEPEIIAQRVAEAGVVGMGGATFPAAIKLNLGSRHHIDTLIINGSECEPYLTCDDRLMRERTDEVVDGIRIIRHALGARRALVVVEDNKPEALAALQARLYEMDTIEAMAVPTRYPMGSEKHMIKAVTGREIPAGKLGADIGVIVHNVGTAYAVHRAVRMRRPLISRIVTVGGGAVQRPANLEVLLGTRVEDLLAHCGGTRQPPARLLMGGPMMGQVMPHAQVPIIKGSNGIIALTAEEINIGETMPCIRCGRCVAACPCGLMPLEMAARIRKEDMDGAVDYGLMDCVACGSCSYVCPSHIPLVQYFHHAKGVLGARREQQRRQEEIKRLAQQRRERQEAEARAKAEAAERRKAEREAAKRKADEAKAARAAKAAAAKETPKTLAADEAKA
ncbi:electron transport complex subunit RsxC [Ectothiorhodospira lacustris]|uniref:electron transport complex subunit RsxC n=1 Tax=Ectothiorhodospira lacustris TaxID=2899127 RepID=UPI001EE920A6|nr:electron transport complex subunit RsxC [Ectothiorhodospira lacustris]MCG5500293.1 electron transport complex subunit RsxC [Ectothiorhodospira lacustris]